MKNKGFTLIELSMVLVIIGLMVGGIVGGKALIHQARLQNLVRDFYKYETAVNTYKSQYDALPGDHPEAEEYWPGKTNNGNGDGMIWDHFTGFAHDAAADDEHTKFWQHLVLAEMIGFHYFTQYHNTYPGINLPEGPFDGQAYRPEAQDYSHGPDLENGRYGNHIGNILWAAMGPYPPGDLAGGFLKPADARTVDLKMDDGIPTRGKLYGVVGDLPGGIATDEDACVRGSTGADDPGDEVYQLSSTDRACKVGYWLD